ncbi:sodium/myo-inositol cotransporter 2 isoform X2 [Strongylocentrotus purpuratus]|uniref:Sodium/glucose cotransporter 4 n=1 Tax=Strongylocentrotus purpuratus TaxID=7668 RepID=A0A7M7HG40_STRPU|nr:sodium/myo-inositol cotransporter 2 isoform X2 [Strongylocentrotus purpuratus]|eukprot:XP_011673080.1 PREDICTED: sodium/myo-inositol cotransporter 2 isoform X2 [Strongylocentrotus purpuratus]
MCVHRMDFHGRSHMRAPLYKKVSSRRDGRKPENRTRHRVLELHSKNHYGDITARSINGHQRILNIVTAIATWNITIFKMATAVLVPGDYAAIVCYFMVVFGAGLYALFTSNRGTVNGYFLAGRYMTWLPVGASIWASNIGSEHFVGLAGDAAVTGISPAAFDLNGLSLLPLMAYLFVPVYIASGVCTLPEYMMKRFGSNRIRIYLACMSIFLYIVSRISVDLYSGALFITQALGWNQYAAIGILLIFVAIFTVTGGLAAVIYTDTVQVFIIIIGGIILMVLSYGEIGSFQELKIRYFQAIPNATLNTPNYTCGIPKEDSFQMLRDIDPFTSSFPWLGFLIGQTLSSLTYWCAEQVMVQRALAAKSLSHAQGGCLFAGFCKILPLFMTVIPGMIARVLYTDTVACASPETCMEACGNPKGCSNTAYPTLVLGIMPAGLRGVMFAVMLSAIVSSMTSLLNSISTLFTVDIWQFVREKYYHTKPSNREMMIVGRVIVLVMTALSVLWIPVIDLLQGDNLLKYFTRIQGRVTPTVAAVYILAVLWPRANEKGTFWGLIIGASVGLIRLILDFIYPDPSCWDEDTRPMVVKLHYFYFNMILFIIVFASVIIISLMTEPLPKYRVIRTTFFTRYLKLERPDEKQLHSDINEEKDYQMLSQDVIEVKNGHAVIEDEERPKPPLQQRVLAWFCGYGEETEEGRRLAREQGLHNRKLGSLEQDPRAKKFLYFCMILLIAIVIFMYTFFSVEWI